MKSIINPRQFIEKMNMKLKAEISYIEGMEVFLTPDSNHPLGYAFDEKWRGRGIESLVTKAQSEIFKEYEINSSLPLL